VGLAVKEVEWRGAKVGKEAENDVAGEVSGVIGAETDWRNTCFRESKVGSWGDWLALLVTSFSGYERLAYFKRRSKRKAHLHNSLPACIPSGKVICQRLGFVSFLEKCHHELCEHA